MMACPFDYLRKTSDKGTFPNLDKSSVNRYVIKQNIEVRAFRKAFVLDVRRKQMEFL